MCGRARAIAKEVCPAVICSDTQFLLDDTSNDLRSEGGPFKHVMGTKGLAHVVQFKLHGLLPCFAGNAQNAKVSAEPFDPPLKPVGLQRTTRPFDRLQLRYHLLVHHEQVAEDADITFKRRDPLFQIKDFLRSRMIGGRR